MNGDELIALLPHDKYDCTRAKKLVSMGYPAVAPVLPQLMEWMQDTNWPVTYEVIAPFLATIGEPLLPEIRRILQTDDPMWIYWILLALVEPSPFLLDSLRSDLEEFSRHLSNDEDHQLVKEAVEDLLRRI